MSDFLTWLGSIEGAIIWDGGCLLAMLIGCAVIDARPARRKP